MKSINFISRYFAAKKEAKLLAEVYAYFFPKYQCSKWLLLMGKIYRNYFYRCTIVVDSCELLEYFRALNEREQGFSRGDNLRRKRTCFIDWLSEADNKLDAVTILDKDMKDFVQNNFYQIMDLKSIKIYCPDCKIDFKYSEIIRQNSKLHKGWNKVISTWECRVGHILHRQESVAHVFCGVGS